MEEEQAIRRADLGHDVRTMHPNRAATLPLTLDGIHIRFKGRAVDALDVVLRLPELFGQLLILLTKSLVGRAQLTQRNLCARQRGEAAAPC